MLMNQPPKLSQTGITGLLKLIYFDPGCGYARSPKTHGDSIRFSIICAGFRDLHVRGRVVDVLAIENEDVTLNPFAEFVSRRPLLQTLIDSIPIVILLLALYGGLKEYERKRDADKEALIHNLQSQIEASKHSGLRQTH
jgi:hypothetical protein